MSVIRAFYNLHFIAYTETRTCPSVLESLYRDPLPDSCPFHCVYSG